VECLSARLKCLAKVALVAYGDCWRFADLWLVFVFMLNKKVRLF